MPNLPKGKKKERGCICLEDNKLTQVLCPVHNMRCCKDMQGTLPSHRKFSLSDLKSAAKEFVIECCRSRTEAEIHKMTIDNFLSYLEKR